MPRAPRRADVLPPRALGSGFLPSAGTSREEERWAAGPACPGASRAKGWARLDACLHGKELAQTDKPGGPRGGGLVPRGTCASRAGIPACWVGREGPGGKPQPAVPQRCHHCQGLQEADHACALNPAGQRGKRCHAFPSPEAGLVLGLSRGCSGFPAELRPAKPSPEAWPGLGSPRPQTFSPAAAPPPDS